MVPVTLKLNPGLLYWSMAPPEVLLTVPADVLPGPPMLDEPPTDLAPMPTIPAPLTELPWAPLPPPEMDVAFMRPPEVKAPPAIPPELA